MLGLTTIILIGLSLALTSDELKLSMKNAADAKKPKVSAPEGSPEGSPVIDDPWL